MTRKLSKRTACDDTGLLTLPEAAEYLSVSEDTIRAMIQRGEIPSLIVGKRSRRIPHRELIAYAEQRLKESVK